MQSRESEIIRILKKEVKPALGCTEPIAVAFATAKAMETIIEQTKIDRSIRTSGGFKVTVEISGNILKNGMGVGIPGTGMVGLDIAAGLGAVCGKTEFGLEVLNDVNDTYVDYAKQLIDNNKIEITLAETSKKLYIRASIELPDTKVASAVVERDHDNVVEISYCGAVLYTAEGTDEDDGHEDTGYNLSIKEIYDFARNTDYDKIKFILESRTLNLALAEEGLKGKYGLKVGYALMSSKNQQIFGDDLMNYAMGLTAAASDARMAGCTMAAMSNSGSGNQGITATMPIIAYGLRNQIDDELLARALVLSHLTAIHIKTFLGKLSALCGCVIASTGSACGLVYLNGGGYENICYAIKNMIGNISGMLCDGAKEGCAMKVASGVSSAIQSAVLAMEDICISYHDGIIEKDIEKTIQNLGKIGSVGMQDTDRMILDIMICK